VSTRRPDRIPQIKSVMTPFPWHVVPGDALAQAKALMREHDIRHLPVMEADALVGIVTDRDIGLVESVVGQSGDVTSLVVRDVGIRDAYVVDLTAPLDRVLTEMAERHIDSALVVKNGRLAGIFTATDACERFGEFLRWVYAPAGGGDAA